MGVALISLESLPHSCDDVIEYVQANHASSVVMVTAGPVTSSLSPRPLPAPYDPYHELCAVLQRIMCLRLATQRHPSAKAVCLLDGWTPALPSPHPLVHDVACQIARAALPFIHSHTLLELKGDLHESYARILDASDDAEGGGAPQWVPHLGHVFGMWARYEDGLPFPRVQRHMITLPSYCNETPVLVERTGKWIIDRLTSLA